MLKSKKSIIESYDGLVKSVETLAETQARTLELLDRAVVSVNQLKMALAIVPGDRNGSLGKVKTGSEKRRGLRKIFTRLS